MSEADDPGVVSKGELARLLRVTPGRVSQWLAEGKIHGPAIVGLGRNARIDLEAAKSQLRLSLDVGQRFGNGAETDLRPGIAAAPAPAPLADPVEDRLRREKLREIEFRNRAAAEQELARRGAYVRADQSKAAMGSALREMLTVFEGALTDLASAIAARFEIPQRDVLHLMKTEFRPVRQRAAEAAAVRSGELPNIVPDLQEDGEGVP